MKWFIPLIALALAALILGAAHNSLATESSLATERAVSSKKVTCSYGGQFKHSSTSAHEARKATSDACFESQLDTFQSQRGSLPSDEQADYIIESCVNQTVCS